MRGKANDLLILRLNTLPGEFYIKSAQFTLRIDILDRHVHRVIWGKAMRHLICLGIILTASAAQADVTQICDGKYAQAAGLVDTALRTTGAIYSDDEAGTNGHYFSNIGNLALTVNLYRAMSGLEPLSELNSYHPEGYIDYRDFRRASPEERINEVKAALAIMTEPREALGGADEIGRASRILAISTTLHPSQDWWLRPASAFNDVEYAMGRYGQRLQKGLSPFQIELGKLSKSSAALDWLQSAMVTSRASRVWPVNPQELSSELETVLKHVENKADEGNALNPYSALLGASKLYGRQKGQRQFKAPFKAIQNCEASTADYTILTAGQHILPDKFMPPERLNAHLLAESKLKTLEKDFHFDAAYFDYVMTLKARATDKNQFTLSLLYSASRREQFTQALAETTSYSHTAYLSEPALFLPVDVIEHYAPATAFARYIALREYDQARRVLDAEIDKNPALAEGLEDILEASIPNSASMPLAALRMPCISLNFSHFCPVNADGLYRSAYKTAKGRGRQHTHRNWSRQSDMMGSVLNRWLGCSVTPHKPFKPLIGMTAHRTRHHNHTHRVQPEQTPPEEGTTRQCGGGRMINDNTPLKFAFFSPDSAVNIENIKLMNDERRLSYALSQDIINWAKSGPTGRFSRKPHQDLMAEGLARVVRLHRHESGGIIDDMPAGQRAHKLLHTRFRKTDWADKTPYWWKSWVEH